MDNISVLIIEDTPAQSDRLVNTLEENNFTVVGVAPSLTEALSLFYGSDKIDIVIIDIFLNGVPDGIAFAETINAVPNASKPFVFLTSSTDRQIFQRAKLEEDTVISDEYLFIKKGKSLKKVRITDIIYIEVEEKYCNIITEKEKFVILISLTKILKLLDNNIFCRTHRNYIANIEKIEEIILADNLIILSGNHKVTLSDTYKDIVKRMRTLK